MANDEHVKLLQSGIEAWNAWRGVNLDVSPDLDDAFLYRASLNGANFDRTSLNGANLDRATLDGANLDGANLVGATFNGANLNDTRLNGATLDSTRLDGATLDSTRLGELFFGKTVFSNVNLSSVYGLDTCEHQALVSSTLIP